MEHPILHQKTFLLIFASVLFNCVSLNAQEAVWAKNKVNISGRSSKGIISDSQGNIYDYGTASGQSYVTKYNSVGTLLINKTWTGDINITVLKIDNTDRLFFTGYFQGTITLDGITIQSRGAQDVVLGEMNISCNVIGAKTFGGKKEDYSFGLAIDNIQGKVVITGGVKDSVYINNSLTPRQAQSMFITYYTKALAYSSIQYYDFIPELNDAYPQGNMGYEIVLDNSGNTYVMHFREGQHPLSDPPYIYPLSGIYVMKINAAGTALWSSRIIGMESYYGYDAGRLRVNNAGDAFLLKSSSGKYGGGSAIMRLSSASGETVWTYSGPSDNNYHDIQIDNSNALIIIGQEY